MNAFSAEADPLAAGVDDPEHAARISTSEAVNPLKTRHDPPLLSVILFSLSRDAVLREVRGDATAVRRDSVKWYGYPSSGTGTVPVMAGERTIARTAGRAMDLLLLLADRGQPGLSIRELSDQLGAPRTSIADLLTVLQQRGFVAPTADGRGWRLDFRVLQLGNAYLHEFSVRDIGRTAMRELSRRTGLTTQMAVLDHTDIVYIERHDATRRTSAPRVVTDIGSRLPAYCTSLGKAMLASLPDDEVEHLYGSAQFTPRTKNTITSISRLRAELALVRRRGFAVDLEETIDGVVCIGSAILNAEGRPEAAISLAGLRAGLPPPAIEDLGRTVARAARQVSGLRDGDGATHAPRKATGPRGRSTPTGRERESAGRRRRSGVPPP